MRNWVLALALLGASAGIILFLGRPSRPALSPTSKLQSVESPIRVVPDQTPAAAPPPGGTQLAAAPLAAENAVSPSPPVSSTSKPGPAEGVVTPNSTSTLAGIGEAQLPPQRVLENMRNTIRDYGARFNGNPVGNNAEITQALNGGNPKQVVFVKPDSGLRINGQGELVDGWGTPFFFHQLSSKEMEVRSAGPDRVMWTADDLVSK